MPVIPESPEVTAHADRERFMKEVRLDYWGKPFYYDMDGKPMTLEQWAEWPRNKRHVGDTYLRLRGHVYRVSTVWLGLNHAFYPDSPPLIFETMVFVDGDMSGLDMMDRYATKAQAKKGHRRICRNVRVLVRMDPKPRQLIHNGRKP